MALVSIPALLDQNKEAQSRKEQTINNLIRSAESNLAQGETGLALRNYEMAVEAGVDRSDVFYSLGNLYAEQNQLEPAVNYLRRSTNDPDYAASAFFAIGQLYDKAERLGEAANAYRDALNRVDLQTIGRDEIDELIDMYDSLGDVLIRQSKDTEAADLYNRLVKFINERNLRTEKTALVIISARELNEKLNAASGSRPVTPTPGFSSDGAGSSFGEEDNTITSSIRFGGDENPSLSDGTRSATIATFLGGSASVRATSATTPPPVPVHFPSKIIEMDYMPNVQPYLRAAEEFIRTDRLNAAIDACQEMVPLLPRLCASPCDSFGDLYNSGSSGTSSPEISVYGRPLPVAAGASKIAGMLQTARPT